MKVVFFCGHESLFGRQSLEALAQSTLRPSVIVVGATSTWKRFDRELNKNIVWGMRRQIRRQYYAVKNRRWLNQLIKEHGMRLCYMDDVNSPKGLKDLKALQGDLFICAAYPQILERSWLDLPSQGAIGFHPSILPAFRGAHPHFWAIRKGASETGLTAYRMTTDIDKGEILAQVRFKLDGLNYSQLYSRLGDAMPALIEKTSEVLLGAREAALLNSEMPSSYFRNNQPEDSRLCWEDYSIKEIDCVVRTGIAWAVYRTRKLRIKEGQTLTQHPDLNDALPAGTIQRDKNGKPYIRCLDGWLQVKKWRWQRELFRPRLRSGELVR